MRCHFGTSLEKNMYDRPVLEPQKHINSKRTSIARRPAALSVLVGLSLLGGRPAHRVAGRTDTG